MGFHYPKGGFITAFYDPLKVPDAPTIGTATAGDAEATVAFTAPTNVGGSAITSYTAVSTPGEIEGTGTSSPITVTGLSNGTAYTFQVWATNSYGPSAYSAASGSVTPAAPRMVIGSGNNGSGTYTNVIDYIQIKTTGDATDFGDMTNKIVYYGSCGSSTRGLFAAGSNEGATFTNTIYYITFSTTGNSSTFGGLSGGFIEQGGCSSSTRGLFGGGYSSGASASSNVIWYVTIASTGDATDFGDLTVARRYMANNSCSSPTRGVWAGGLNVSSAVVNVIDYVTIASIGNATDFGDLTVGTNLIVMGSCSSSTRGLFGGGNNNSNTIQYITIASTGNSTDFGDLTVGRSTLSSASSETRGVWAGGNNYKNTIDYVTIASTGDATDFGDLTVGRGDLAACSNAHGGLA